MSITLAMPALIAVAGPAESASAGAPSRLLADDAFQQDCLKAHNTYRARHGVPAMRTEPEGIEAAKKSAAYYAQKGSIDHTSPYKAGRAENLYLASFSGGRVAACADAVNAWYDGIKDYNFNDPDNLASFNNWGRFTQVVWKSSTRLGCAPGTRTDSGRTTTYIVCLYNPPGNVQGQFGSNVPRPVK
ncbi:CAP family protein [Microtetraspora niveoalba]|uniref:CAP family protein n=1 Tax=Microtetraspora niveoalba TaxID=46175 RepID=UPI001471ADF3|nr:CAP family protein [Microtetraspora niveoalba]